MKNRMFKKNKYTKKEAPDIDITSLLDILVILLVFLLRSYNATDLSVDVVKDLDLPISTTDQLGHSAIVVQVDKNGSVFVDNKELVGASFQGERIEMLYNKLKEMEVENKEVQSPRAPAAAAAPSARPINILLHQKHTYEVMQKVMHTAALAGHDQIKLIVTGQN